MQQMTYMCVHGSECISQGDKPSQSGGQPDRREEPNHPRGVRTNQTGPTYGLRAGNNKTTGRVSL